MDLTEFEKTAQQIWEQIPENFRVGVDGLIVKREAHTHPEHDEFFTLGECQTETYPSDFGGPDTTRSAVVLYYGSFAILAREEPDFDWDFEIYETITHELQHHLEHLASEDTLENFDYAVEHNFRRVEGESFDPFFYREGARIGTSVYRVEDDVFYEIVRKDKDTFGCTVSWLEKKYHVQVPASDADVLIAVLEHDMEDVRGEFAIVRVLQQSTAAKVRTAFKGVTVEEVFVPVETVA
jgi:predicted Zn-dependent protease with MMP-like domain